MRERLADWDQAAAGMPSGMPLPMRAFITASPATSDIALRKLRCETG